ncbi:sigma-70 family RNA polymerase sigma factor [Adhaeretor mobilis]|uniref:RNA polymerase sigma factor n=1 Tax=Adhaeretor mobilis TaxID=1930276 RepID=A0A517N1E1_9BACT|nr:sigma-70 family RNA polymerase sigma factor [Adhaeretor mobilis]QDT00945.1 RNA polymerase sigma factor [Adhaeretor mobilis]
MANVLDDGQFVERLTSSQARLRVYAVSLVRDPHDADDLLQNACLTLWEKRQQYDSDREFFPWACGIVLIEILRHRRKKATDKLLFDEALITTLAADYVAKSTEYESRYECLHKCIAKLSDHDRRLLEEHYRKGTKPKKISQQRGLPVTTVYSRLTRIRELLHACIEAGLVQQSHP